MKKLEISSMENIQGGGCNVNPCNPLAGALGCLGSLLGCLALGVSLSAGGCGCGGVSVGVGVCVGL